MSVVGSNPTHEVLYGMGSDVEKERETLRPGDSTDARVIHRFDKMSYRKDIERRECSCDTCECGDSMACIEKRCGCCTVSE